MSKVDIETPKDPLYVITWEYDGKGLFYTKSKGWIPEISVTKNKDVFENIYRGLKAGTTTAHFRNVRAFIMKAEEVFP